MKALLKRSRNRSRLVVKIASRFGLALSMFAPLLVPRVAHAQQYYYPPPPPPPPGYYGYHHRGYEYGDGRVVEPQALDLGLDLEGAAPLNMPTLPDGNRFQGGSGFKLRVGDQVYLGRGLRITPEVAYAYEHLFAADDYGNAYDWDMSRLLVGVRVGFGRFIVPSIYGHVGYGWRNTGDPTLSNAGGVAGDFGGALDFRFWRHLQMGAHVEYASIDATPYAPSWLALGFHLDVLL